MFKTLIFCFAVFGHAYGQTCADVGLINSGPSIGGLCPENTVLQGIECCTTSSSSTTASTATIATTTSSSGSSSSGSSSTSCIGPCFNSQCPTSYTCNTASQECCSTSSGTNTTCVDKTGADGASDCPSLAYLCNNTLYYDIMTDQCAKTCGRCSSTGSTTSSTCVDKTNPTTGTSDCAELAYLCTNSLYTTIMTQQCPRTCGKC